MTISSSSLSRVLPRRVAHRWKPAKLIEPEVRAALSWPFGHELHLALHLAGRLFAAEDRLRARRP